MDHFTTGGIFSMILTALGSTGSTINTRFAMKQGQAARSACAMLSLTSIKLSSDG